MTESVAAALFSAVAQSAMPNTVAVAADCYATAYEAAIGTACCSAGDPVTADSGVRFMSMAKVITPGATLQHVEQRVLSNPHEITTADWVSSWSFNMGPGYKWDLGLNTDDLPGVRPAGSGRAGWPVQQLL